MIFDAIIIVVICILVNVIFYYLKYDRYTITGTYYLTDNPNDEDVMDLHFRLPQTPIDKKIKYIRLKRKDSHNEHTL